MNVKYLFLAVVAAFSMLVTSCDDEQLDQQPSNSLTDDLIISSKETAETVLNGAYMYMEHYYYLTIGMSALEIMGNDIKISNGNYGFSTYKWLMYAYDYVQYADVVDGWWSAYTNYMWSRAYRSIDNCNLLIEAAADGSIPAGCEDMVAQAYGIRGWNFLHLYHLYCAAYNNPQLGGDNGKGLFLRLTKATSEESTMVERSNLKQSFDQIISDLTYAYEHVAENGSYYMNPKACALLLARTYAEINDWANVKKYAEIAASQNFDGSNLMSQAEWQSGFMDANSEWLLGMNFNAETTNIYASFPSFWHSFTSMDKEAVWGTANYGTKVPGNSLAEQFDALGDEGDNSYGAQDYLVGYSTVRACKSFVDTFNKDANGVWTDCRALFPAYLDEADGYFIAKFNQHNTLGIADYPLARIAEAYMLEAEAQYRSGNSAAGLAILNTLQAARGGSISAEINENEIYLEHRREFYGEGHALGLMKRLQMGVNRTGADHWSTTLTLPANSGKMMFPIPDKELDYNPHYKNGNAEYNQGQNDNWAR